MGDIDLTKVPPEIVGEVRRHPAVQPGLLRELLELARDTVAA